MYQLTPTINLEHALDIVTFMDTYSEDNGVLAGTSDNGPWVLVRLNERYVLVESASSDCEQVRIRMLVMEDGRPVIVSDEVH